jgi:hypothetical protein|eukprot:COSAG01_NODE_88_length_27337_cov_22.941699_33_plen_99_part_00
MNVEGLCPLHLASSWGVAPMVTLLLQVRTACDALGLCVLYIRSFTPAHATQAGADPAAKLSGRATWGADVGRGKGGQNSLMIAAGQGHAGRCSMPEAP